MSGESAWEYWEKLKSIWLDIFIQDVVLQFNNLEYVTRIGQATGYAKEEIMDMIRQLPDNGKQELGWSLFDDIWIKTFNRLVETTTDLSFEIEEMPLIGTLPTRRVNALAIITPKHKKYILAFEVGLIPMIVGISDYIASNLQPISGNNSEFKVNEKIDTTKALDLVNMMINYCTDNIPFSGNRFPIEDKKQRSLSQGFRDIIKLFIVGHEYGHVGLDHFTREKEIKFNLTKDVEYTICEIQSHQKEYEADQVGFLISLVYHFKRDLPYWFSAAYIVCFLEFTRYIDMGIEFIFGVKLDSHSHPIIEDRILYLEDVLFQLIPEKQQINYFALKGFNKKLLEVFEKLFIARIEELKREGYFSLVKS